MGSLTQTKDIQTRGSRPLDRERVNFESPSSRNHGFNTSNFSYLQRFPFARETRSRRLRWSDRSWELLLSTRRIHGANKVFVFAYLGPSRPRLTRLSPAFLHVCLFFVRPWPISTWRGTHFPYPLALNFDLNLGSDRVGPLHRVDAYGPYGPTPAEEPHLFSLFPW